MLQERHKKKHMRSGSRKLHKKINSLKTFLELLQLLKTIIDFFH